MEKEYHREFYNKLDEKEQWIRLSDGCYRNCEFCYCPTDKLYYQIPQIERNVVKIMDMNFLYAYPNVKDIIEILGQQKVDAKVVYYELICGIDWRLIDLETALLLKKNRFVNLRLAWDGSFKEQKMLCKAINLLKKVGYTFADLSVFMVCNFKIPFDECMLKLDLLKIWRVKVNDCWFDNQTSPNIKPMYWTEDEIKLFRKRCRKHNQMVRFNIDPEYK